MHAPDQPNSTNQQAERTIALNYFKATLEQMPTEIQKHPVLLTAIETMEHLISGEGTDADRQRLFELTSDLHHETRTLDPSCGFDVANNPFSMMAGAANCLFDDDINDIIYTSTACDISLIMHRTGVGLVEAKERLEERFKLNERTT
jgi:hypothetical protein